MKRLRVATIAAGALTAAALGFAGSATAAPSGPGNAQQTIDELKAQGYHVILNHIGSTPLSDADVVEVREGQTHSRTDSSAPGSRDDIVTTVTSRTIYVTVK